MPKSLLDHTILDKFSDLDANGKVLAEYVWLGGGGWDIRCKTKTLDAPPTCPEDLPIWNYDGSSTGQAPGHDSEVFMVPRAIFKDPFRKGENVLVMCDVYEPPKPGDMLGDDIRDRMKPLPSNTRHACALTMEKYKDEVPWFGIEQEYTLLDGKTKWPLGWPKNGFPGPQGPYYCSAGTGIAIGRDIIEAHYKACLYAGVLISGVNAEVMPGQWEYQVGPCLGIEMGDHMWMSRYLMLRVAEFYNVIASFDPKPIPGDWNGAGCHTNFSTESTRKAGGWEVIQKHCEKLGKKHMEHILAYGEGNERRLTGLHETAPLDKFSWGVANRGASIRVPRMVPVEGKGYYEDRRPSSNMDPYVVTRLIAETTLGE